MNHTHIALLALLLPFSGYAITKEERMREIEATVQKMNERAAEIITYHCYVDPFSVFVCSHEEREKIVKELQEYLTQIELLNEEYGTLKKSQEDNA